MRRKLIHALLLSVGVAFFIKLLLEYDLDAIWSDLCRMGVSFGWILLLWLLVLGLDTFTWRHTFGDLGHRVPCLGLVWITAAGQAINGVAPSGNLGEIVKGKYLAEYIDPSDSISSLVLFNYLHLMGSVLLIALGAFLSLLLPSVPGALSAVLIGISVMLLGVVALLFFVSGKGLAEKSIRLFRRLRIPLKKTDEIIAGARRVDKKLREYYCQSTADFWIAVAGQVASRLVSVVEIYTICLLLRRPISFLAALLVMSASQLIAWLFAVVPGQIGIMEQGSDKLFTAMGFQPGVGFAFELVRRGRRLTQIAFGLLALALLGLRSSAPAPEEVVRDGI
ncbi:MAG: flippase-like domain-containing protein [Deltaproteobacteria bacterium]|nr:flippase-like domain-containing protein [Deltaproteobacteria bacterium]